MKYLLSALINISVIVMVGCDADSMGARGFSLPEGNPDTGKVVFTDLKCNSCHHLTDIAQLPAIGDQTISVKLGGEVARIKTYGELVSSIINPSHRIADHAPQNTDAEGQSTMRIYNDVMTVSQLIDLVSFLETQYTLRPYEPSSYRPYHF